MKFTSLLNKIKELDTEVGGYFKITTLKKLSELNFVISDHGKQNVSIGREYVDLPTSKHNYVWHYHPDKLGIWPSFEDLMISVPSNTKRFGYYLNIIVTNHGCWIFDGLFQETKKHISWREQEDMKKTWNEFHIFMTSETQRVDGWILSKIQRGVEQFRYEMMSKHGFRISFIDNGLFRNVSKTEYIKDVHNYINYTIESTSNTTQN